MWCDLSNTMPILLFLGSTMTLHVVVLGYRSQKTGTAEIFFSADDVPTFFHYYSPESLNMFLVRDFDRRCSIQKLCIGKILQARRKRPVRNKIPCSHGLLFYV